MLVAKLDVRGVPTDYSNSLNIDGEGMRAVVAAVRGASHKVYY